MENVPKIAKAAMMIIANALLEAALMDMVPFMRKMLTHENVGNAQKIAKNATQTVQNVKLMDAKKVTETFGTIKVKTRVNVRNAQLIVEAAATTVPNVIIVILIMDIY